MAGRNPNWTQEETLMAFLLYLKLEPKQKDDKGEEVQKLARMIGRPATAVNMKIFNIAHHDANRRADGRVGLSHGAKLERRIWQMYAENPDGVIEQALAIYDRYSRAAQAGAALGEEKLGAWSGANRPAEGEEAPAVIADIAVGPEVELDIETERMGRRVARVGQSYFRNSLLANYGHACCLTGIAEPKLLVASHIKPWARCESPGERLAASNGLLLNAFHDRAFDQGLITVDAHSLRVRVSSKLAVCDETSRSWLADFAGREIRMPQAQPPRRDFLEYHNDCVFERVA